MEKIREKNWNVFTGVFNHSFGFFEREFECFGAAFRNYHTNWLAEKKQLTVTSDK